MHHHSGYRSYQPRTICNQLFSSHGEDVELGAVHREGRYPGALPRESNLYALTAFFLLLRPSHSAVRRLQRRSEAYTITTEKLVALRELVYEAKGVLIPCLNLGGGFPSSVKLHGTPEDFKIPAIEEYAEAITKVLDRLPKRQRPQLRLETGRPATRETIAAPLTLGGRGDVEHQTTNLGVGSSNLSGRANIIKDLRQLTN
jgi:hypothetical protein